VTQTTRLIAYLKAHPGASSLEIIRDLAIVNTTGRISDIRALPGFDVDCRKRPDGRDGYWLTEGESGPGMARITATDSARQVDRKMAAAFAPVRTLREELESIFGGDR
jgi:hypothetical protein